MFQVLSFAVILLNVFLVWFPSFSFNLLLLCRWLQLLLVLSDISCPTFFVFLYTDSCVFFFLLPFAYISVRGSIATSMSMHVTSFLFLITISGLLAELISLCVPPDTITPYHLVHILVWVCVCVCVCVQFVCRFDA